MLEGDNQKQADFLSRSLVNSRSQEIAQPPFDHLQHQPDGAPHPIRVGNVRRRTNPVGQPFGASRAAERGLVTSFVPDQNLLGTATDPVQIRASSHAIPRSSVPP